MTTERRVEVGLLIVLTFAMIGLAFSQATNITPESRLLIIFFPVASAALLFAGWRGWRWTRALIVLTVTGLVGGMLPDQFLLYETSLVTLLAPVLSVILLSSRWTLASGSLTLALLIGRAQGQGVYTEPAVLVIFFMLVGLLALSQVLMQQARSAAERAQNTAQEARRVAEEQAEALAAANAQANEQLEQQRKLLELVAALEVPAVPLANGVLLAPIVGHIDTRRASSLSARLLDAAHAQRARLIILDITGVSLVDTSVARSLLSTAQALRLLGCDVTISGISADVALTLTSLGISMAGVTTVRSPQEALAYAAA